MTIHGIGLDLASVARIGRLLDGPLGERFRRRCFTAEERAYSDRVSGERRAERYAARFAAKEALAKALGAPPGLRFQDAEVVTTSRGPVFKLSGVAAGAPGRVLLTLTHDGGMAAAMVVIDGGAP